MDYIYSRKKISLRRFRKCISSIFFVAFLFSNIYSLFPLVAFAEEVPEISNPVEVIETPSDTPVVETEVVPIEITNPLENLWVDISTTPSATTTTENTEEELLVSTSTPPVTSEILETSELASTSTSTEIITTKKTVAPLLDFENSLVDLTLPENISEDILIKSTKDIESLPLRLSLSRTTSTSTPILRNEYVVYENVFGNTDVEYKITNNGLKENIILKTSDHPSEFVYTINLEQYDHVLTDNILRLYKKGYQGNNLFLQYTISAPYMSDYFGATSTQISLDIVEGEIVITPDAEWLTQATYPVIVDPTVEVSVLNVHSNPVAGDLWKVDFTTVGTGDLTIRPADQATIDDDQFTSLFCGAEDRTASTTILTGDIIFYPNWNCDEVATINHITLTTGNHHLIFEFANQTESATSEAFNANITWDGGGADALWNTVANWSTNTAPTTADVAVFDGTCASNCSPTINVAISVLGISMNAGYAGTITQAAGTSITIALNTSGFVLAAGTFTGNNANITITDGSFNQSGGSFTAPNATTSIERDFTVSAGTFSATVGTFAFVDSNATDDSTLTCTGVTFTKVVLTKDSNGDMIISSGCTVPLGASPTSAVSVASTWAGTVTIASGTWTVNGAGNITNNGTITHSGSGWVSAGGLIMGSSGSVTYSGSTITFMLDLNISSGTFPSGKDITFTTTGLSTQNTTVTCTGSPFNKVIITKTDTGSGFTVASGCTIPLGASPTSLVGSSFTNNGTVTVSSGTWTANGAINLANNGTITHSGSGWASQGGLIMGSSGVVTYSGTAISLWLDLNISVGTFPSALDLTFTSSGLSTINSTLTTPTGYSMSSLTISKNNSNTMSFAGAASTTITGALTWSTVNTVNNPSTARTLIVQGNASFSSTLTFGGANLTLSFQGTATSTLSRTAGNIQSPIIVTKTGVGGVALGSGFFASSTLAIQGGLFDASSYANTIAGLTTISGGTYIAGSGTQTLNSGLTVSGGTFTGGSGITDINGTLTHSSGTVNPAGTMTISGNLTRTGGTFSASSGTVTFDGTNQSISGNNTFYNLTKSGSSAATLTIDALTTNTVTNTLTLSGAASNLLSLRSSSSGSQWNINPQGTRTLSYLDIKDSNNTNSLVINAISINSTDSGNNTNWIFTNPTYSEQDYRFYTNIDSLNPTSALGTQSATTTIYSTSSPIRLLTNLTIGTHLFPSLFQTFKLQVATSSFNWLDVTEPGGSGSASAWWDTSWLKRKAITVTNNTASTLTNFQVSIPVTYDADMQADFDDLRFTNSSGTALDHWTEKYTASTDATVWVEVDSISASSNATIHMYYGNSLVANGSSIANTFVFGDEFSGSSVDSAVWTVTDATGWTVTGGELSGTNTTGRLTSISTFSDATVLEIKSRYTTLPTNGYMVGGFNLSTSNGVGYLNHATQDFYRNNSSWVSIASPAPSSTNLLTKFTVKSSTLVDLSVTNYSLGTSYQSVSNISNTVSAEPIRLGRRYDDGNTGQTYQAYWDWVRVRKYASSDPSLSTAAEESSGSIYWSFYNNTNVASGTPLTAFLLSTSDIGGSYMESNPTASNPNSAAIGEQVEWSFPLNVTSILSGVDYYFRLILNTGTTLASYVYPVLNMVVDTTAPTAGSLSLTATETTISASISGASDSGSGLSSTPYIFYNTTLGTNSGAQSATTWSNSGLTSGTTYSFEVSVTDLAGNTATTSIATISTNSKGNGNGGPGAGGGGIGSPPRPPSKGFSVVINNGATTTLSSQVTLNLNGGPDTTRVLISNTPDFIGAQLQDYEKSVPWTLCTGICANGTYGVYVKYYTLFGAASPLVYDTIDLIYQGNTYTPPPIDKKAPLQVGLGASYDSKNYFSPLLGITTRNKVSLKADTSLQTVGKDKLTYTFDCTSDGIIDYTVSNSSQTSIVATNICTYPNTGVYTAKVTTSRLSSSATKTVIVSVGNPVVPPVIPPPIIVPPIIVPPIVVAPPVLPPTETPPVSIPPEVPLSPTIPSPPVIPKNIENTGEAPINTPSVISYTRSQIVSFVESIGGVIGTVFTAVIDAVVDSTVIRIGAVSIAPVILATQYSVSSINLFMNIKSGSDAVYAVTSLFSGLLTALGIRKRRRRWGTVYDSVTKQPIDPVLVELIDARTGKVVEESITDMFGRFGFLERIGRYSIRAHKTNYRFPSQVVIGTTDMLFEHVYHGELFDVFSEEDIIAPNIPMDQVSSDWNQIEKKRLGFTTNIYLDVIIAKTLQVIFWAGFIFTGFMFLSNPSVINGIFIGFYVLLAVVNLYLPKPHLWGKIISTKINPSGLLVELRHESIPDVVIGKVITNDSGKFTLKAMPGRRYVVKVKSIGDSSNVLLAEQTVTVGGDGVVNDVISLD